MVGRYIDVRHPKHFDTDEATSKRMASVTLKRGKLEQLLSSKLWSKGFRFRLNYKKLPGSPDIAILKYKIAVFVDGEFWHGFDWEKRKMKLKRNRVYWIEKIEENMARDKSVDTKLNALGWKPVRFWSKDVKNSLNECVSIIEELTSHSSF